MGRAASPSPLDRPKADQLLRRRRLRAATATLLQPLLDQEPAIVFCDLTTIRTDGGCDVPDELRQKGMAKEGTIARRTQHHQVSLNARPKAAGLTTLSPEQQELFAAVGLPPPTAVL